MIQYFLNKKLPVNVVNKNGDTPLHLAMKTNNSEVFLIHNSFIKIKVIKLLFDHGAEIDIVNNENATPVDYASV